MNKNTIYKMGVIETISKKSNISKNDVKTVLDAFIDVTISSLKENMKVSIIGFGSFSIKQRNPRDGKHPKTGKLIRIPSKVLVKFSAGKNLNEEIQK